MVEYEPWSTNVINESIIKYKNRELSMLDIELSGVCNYKCIYCDSPDKSVVCKIPFERVDEILQTDKVTWVFVCGLGEPTVAKNYEHLIKLLDSCKRNNVKCSVFTNLSNLTSELEEYIKHDVLYLLFKYDSSDEKVINDIYSPTSAKAQVNNIKKIEKLVRIKGDTTNLAASIVPTRLNRGEITKIVEHCLSAGIFPFVGELENSGKAVECYDSLSLSRQELENIKMQIEDKMGCNYILPVCPTVISGIHIDCDSKVVVDKFSGLSCHWFWLEEPESEIVMDFDGEATLENISKKIISIRNRRFDQVVQAADSVQSLVFGACGGDIKALLHQYIKVHKCLLRQEYKLV